jgi:EAL domain-containing protein (putative c-di-GMP-specific phosphodiesterase class I)
VRGLVADDFDVAYQPIVDLEEKRIFAFEALARCRSAAFANPSRLFAAASREGACGRIGRMVREVALARCSGVPLFINIHPDELSARWLVRPDDPIFFYDDQLFLEITESAAFSHFDLCCSVLRELRARAGCRLAVDDLGAGFSNLKRVVDLEPQVVKLDRTLVQRLHTSPRQQTLVAFLVDLCRQLGAVVVAEGIETLEEFSAVCDSGVRFGQGYLFARPGFPLPNAHWPGAGSLPPQAARKHPER